VAQLRDDGRWNHYSAVKPLQSADAFYLYKVVQRRGIGDDDHALAAICAVLVELAEGLNIRLKVFGAVCVVENIPFLEKAFELEPGAEAEDSAGLKCRELSRTISGYRESLNGFACRLGMLIEIVR
jgi:hypothetical protein